MVAYYKNAKLGNNSIHYCAYRFGECGCTRMCMRENMPEGINMVYEIPISEFEIQELLICKVSHGTVVSLH